MGNIPKSGSPEMLSSLPVGTGSNAYYPPLAHIVILHFVKKRESKWLNPLFALKHRPKVDLFE
jgi:hypothetical protein